MTPREFLQANMDVIDPAILKKAAGDLDKLSNDAWVKKYFNDFSSNESTAIDFRNLMNYKSLPERLRGSFGNMGFNPSDVWKKAIYQTEYSDVPLEEFESALANMKNYYDYETKLQDETKALNERKKEVKDWGWRNLVASDYEKQRYLDDPKSSLFGKQSPELGEAPETRWGSIGDLGTGVLAGAADIATAPLPIVNTVAGPTIRLGRDVAHKLSDSPYKKDWSEIGSDYITDVGFNAGTQAIANARKLARMASNLSDPGVRQAFETSLQTDAIKSGLNTLSKPSNTVEFARKVRQLPESPLKQDLMETISDFANSGVDVNKADAIMKKYKYISNKGKQELYSDIATGQLQGQMPKVTGNNKSYLNDILLQPELRGYNKLNYNVLRGINKVNVGIPGTIIFETLTDAKGRGNTPNVVETDERIEDFNRKKEAMKAQFGESWLKFGDNFKPKEIEGDPAWEAYKEVMGIE